MTRRLISSGVAIWIGILSCIVAYEYAQPAAGGWQEIVWPYPRDGWPPGRAYHCSVASCGDELDLYVRPKLGFCNCDSGVADDDEVDRVADLDLVSDRFVPLEAGKVIRVADLHGRLRDYELQMPDGSRRTAIGIAASRRCDLMVAVVVGKIAASGYQKQALDFLASKVMASWINASLAGG
jgi:hypothetical protein